jgi:pSer/pThr/pTyr-binding forkhead associated (FHA) protein/tetratricopeptide (TPR) repeat protein
MAGAASLIESAEVVIKQAGHADRVVRLSEGATRMGRAEDNEIVLSDVGVSRRHAQVYVSRGEVTVEDLGSGNGTYYNGYRIQSQPVQDGDEIVIDPFTLMFRIRGQERASRAEDRGQGAPARLQMVNGTGAGGAGYPITSRGLSIGRSEDSDVVIADPAASRHHCQINLQSGEHVLRDMGSANGVFVNAVRVRECTLADGDLVRIGNTEMRFVRESTGAEAPRQSRGQSGQSRYDSRNDSRDGRFEGGRPEAGRSDTGRSDTGRLDGRNDRFDTTGTSSVRGQTYTGQTGKTGAAKPVLAMMFGGMVVFFGLVTVLLFVLVVVVLLVQYPPWGGPVSQFEARPPVWALNEPPGLEAAKVDVLFTQGLEKMSASDYKDALLDFYRVARVDPAYPGVDKFAFAAGEVVALNALEKELQRRAEERALLNKERDQLLLDAREGARSVQLRAQNKLKRQFGDDPLILKEFGLTPPPSVVAREKLAADGKKFLEEERYDEASKAFQDVLDGSKDKASREEALANLRAAQSKLAQQATEKWSRAVIASATKDYANARSLFSQIKSEHPAHPSAQLHLSRLPQQ